MAWIGSRLKDAEIALHNGDAAPRFAIWSRNEPVTVLGAWMSGSGPEEVGHIFRQLEASFSDCTSYSHEVIAADVIGDMAYTLGYEHTSTRAPRRTESRETTRCEMPIPTRPSIHRLRPHALLNRRAAGHHVCLMRPPPASRSLDGSRCPQLGTILMGCLPPNGFMPPHSAVVNSN